MAYPSLEQYNQAFQLHERLLADPELKTGTIATTGLGLPLVISGGFALTYTINSGTKKFAVRCFHRESKALQQRYFSISKRISSLNSPYFLDFEFQPQGIKVDGVGYPIVKMTWAKGETLGEFLEVNRSNASALSKLSNSIYSLAAFLEKEKIAHGDLQTGNLMVSAGGSVVQLIDYDGMYVEELKNIGSTELGHANFQHPQRQSTNPYDQKIDRFSLILLAVTLKALRLDPNLWNKTKSEVDAILFRANDFIDPESSQTFALLSSNPAIEVDIKNFASICKSPIEKVPSLADFLSGKQTPNQAVTLTGLDKPNNRKTGYISAYDVLSAMDYQACLQHVGDRVEVIGRILEVKTNHTRNGDPYVFINFGDWRGRIFKVSIWSEGLAAIKTPPDETWIGKWLSVVGLMEPPYSNPKFKYSHLSISITSSGQMTFVAESDAKWRLAGSTANIPKFTTSSNQEALDRIKGRPATSTVPIRLSPAPTPQPTPLKPTGSSASAANREAIEKIRAANHPASPPSSTKPSNTPYTPPRHSSPQSSNQEANTDQHKLPAREKGVVEKIFNWLFG
ncbi:MAG: serine/threonine protein kinase [Giesbergeria sp.]|uniref:serine/threonine protein kinase n=1 Tax=Giesbergeria sp. TaxID=2818473 RepID=UPI002628CF34|nr:serine/threonine protein kinase [Giesbergeria sp.]MDD2609996.1 serine/threonine protein kinase [Giesbergeria sp.]